LLATIEADEAMRSNLGAAGLTKAEQEAIAGKLDPWKGTEEPVSGYWKKKSSGKGHRFICKFGLENRALQYLVRDVLIAQLELHPNQYATRGGVHAAIKHTKQALSDGYLWAAELDIKDCYPSFDESKLPNLLPLPKEVTDNVIISKYLNLQGVGIPQVGQVEGPADDDEGDLVTLAASPAAARQGIPQGSAASDIIAEAMIAIVLKQVPSPGVIVAYADNILLLAKSESDVASMIEALGAALEAHPVGRLRPSVKAFAPVEPIEFLGHLLRCTEGVVRIEPSPRNLQKFETEVTRRLSCLSNTKLPSGIRRKRRKELGRYIQSWTQQFKLCDDIDEIRSQQQALVEEAVESICTYKTFNLYPDQKELVDQALQLAKDKSGTTFDTVALEYIATQFMGTGLTFKDHKTALTAARKTAGDDETFLTEVMPVIESLVPGLVLKLEYAEKE
jgi:hypothetical protein